MSVQDMEDTLKRELSTLRKETQEGAPAQSAPSSAPPATAASGKKKKTKEDDSCCVIAWKISSTMWRHVNSSGVTWM